MLGEEDGTNDGTNDGTKLGASEGMLDGSSVLTICRQEELAITLEDILSSQGMHKVEL